MRIREKNVILKNGQRIILRSPESQDGKAMLDHMKLTSGESYFLVRYPEEIKRQVEAEESFLNTVCEDKKDVMIVACAGEKIIGCGSVMKVGEQLKCIHRADMGISIQEKYCNEGLGAFMVKELLTYAKDNFEQIELGVFEDNSRAIHLYEKLGFKRFGVIPRAFKLKDGTYRDEIQMIYINK